MALHVAPVLALATSSAAVRVRRGASAFVLRTTSVSPSLLQPHLRWIRRHGNLRTQPLYVLTKSSMSRSVSISSPERNRRISVVGAWGTVGVWNNGVPSPFWAARLPSPAARPAAVLASVDHNLARATWIHLVVAEVAGPLRAPLAVRKLVWRAARRLRAAVRLTLESRGRRCRDRTLVLLVKTSVVSDTGLAMCAILTRRTVSSITLLSSPSAFLSVSSRRSALSSPASAAGKSFTMRRPSRSPV
eukprot:6179842-Pleurochrysis_carterae.AAC.7